ncbi:SIR2 family protein [Clostridium akagii]|uniref:SIR2 family protein n=1 Tax=Clostridium akagii TaxID=91623 RepID=UPI00047E92A6|nr:SIR2 family protein [Clostridium akagii]
MDYKEEYINQIANHLLNDNLALFIGAGFSKEFGYPSWKELLIEIINTNNIRSELIKSNIFPFVSAESFDNSISINKYILNNLLGVDYLRLAGYVDFLLKKNSGSDIHSMVIDKINTYESKRLKTDETEVIIEFFSKYKEYLADIITTNYDTNIEYCMDNDVSVISRKLSTLNDLKGKNRLYKIHGCIKDKMDNNPMELDSSIVITEKDYNNFKAKNRYLFYRTYSIFTEKKVAFIGYSINDPNIRSLLNDVIEESNNSVNLQMYWINKDKMREIDKSYYEKNYGLRIIEDISLEDFFIVLQDRIEKNMEMRKINTEDIEEYSKEYISKYKDNILLHKILEDKKELQVLNYLYLDIIKDEDNTSIVPFFKLLISCCESIQTEMRLKIQGILELSNHGISRLIDEMEQNKGIVKFLVDSGFKNVQLKSILNYCDGNHSFGVYASCIKNLLKIYDIYDGIDKIFEDEYIDRLSSNIMSSAKTKCYGYDWYGINVVEDRIGILSKKHIMMLLNKYSCRRKDQQQKEQIEAVIKYSSLIDNDKKILGYNYILKYDIEYIVDNMINEILDDYLEEILKYKYKYRQGIYTNIEETRKIAYKTNETDDYIEYLVDDITNDHNIFRFEQKYEVEVDQYRFSLNEDEIVNYTSDIKVKDLKSKVYEDFKLKTEYFLKETVHE